MNGKSSLQEVESKIQGSLSKSIVESKINTAESASYPSNSKSTESFHQPITFGVSVSSHSATKDLSSSASSVLVISSESFVADNLNHNSHEEMTSTIDEISGIGK